MPRALSSSVHTSGWPPTGGRAGLQLCTLTAQTKKIYNIIHFVFLFWQFTAVQ